MATTAETGGSLNDYSPASTDPVNAAITQQNYNAYVAGGGDPSSYTVNAEGQFTSAPRTNASAAAAAAGYGLGGASYAPYDVGGGKTKWDEFVQQMQLEQQKLQQAQDIETARLAQEKALAEAKLAEEQKIADQNTVESFTKNLMSEQGPKDPYGYLFSSRGLAAPQGYAPTAMPLPDAVKAAYQSQGVDLASAQKQLVGDSGPSFISGYLGGMPQSLQQGPMGFENSPQFKNVAPGSQPQPQGGIATPPTPGNSQSLTSSSASPTNPQQPTKMAKGGVVPGYSPGNDTVPAMLSPGEGVLTPQAVQSIGGPSVVSQMNAENPQRFAAGGMVYPTASPQMLSYVNLRGQGANPAYDAGAAGLPLYTLDPGGIFRQANQATPWGSQFQEAAPGETATTGSWGNADNSWMSPDQASFYKIMQNGQPFYVSAADVANVSQSANPNGASNYTLAGQNVGQNSWENAPPAGYAMTTPGVAMPSPQAGQIGQVTKSPNPMVQNTSPIGALTGGQIPSGDLGSRFLGPITGGGIPVGDLGTWGPQSSQSNPMGPGAGLLTGGVLTSPPPTGQAPINLNMLDPYTRSMVDQYGVPQIPSAQALANMPQSGLDAYQNYVEKVAGGNFQDLLDQSKQLNPTGFSSSGLKFS